MAGVAKHNRKPKLVAVSEDDEEYLAFVDRLLCKAYGEPVGIVMAGAVMKSVTLYYTNAAENSDKQYNVFITTSDAVKKLYNVEFAFGKRGGTLNKGMKAKELPLKQCEHIFDELVRDKEKKKYTTKISGIA